MEIEQGMSYEAVGEQSREYARAQSAASDQRKRDRAGRQAIREVETWRDGS